MVQLSEAESHSFTLNSEYSLQSRIKVVASPAQLDIAASTQIVPSEPCLHGGDQKHLSKRRKLVVFCFCIHEQTYYDFYIWFQVLDDSDHASKQPSPSHRNDYGIWLHPQLVHLLQYFQSSNTLSFQDGYIIVAGMRGYKTQIIILVKSLQYIYCCSQSTVGSLR